MIRTIEVVIDEQGNVRLLEPVHLPSARRALLTILEDRPAASTPESALLRLPRTGIVRRRTRRGRT
jgi:hypothetical protein